MKNNTKYNKLIQSAGNFYGSSETTRQLSKKKSFNSFCDKNQDQEKEQEKKKLKKVLEKKNFISWLAGVIDGDGNFDIRKNNCLSSKKTNPFVLKAIRIKLHVRDIRILTRVQNGLHVGKIKVKKNNPHALYIVSTKFEMTEIINLINGQILIKVESFKKSCNLLNIEFKEGNYNVPPYSYYFAGLIDTDGSIVFNYTSNRIECSLELKYNNYTEKLNLDNVIPETRPLVLKRTKTIQKVSDKKYNSILFKYQTVEGMIFLYKAFMKTRLYCDFKFKRISSIKRFLEIRHYRSCSPETVEFKVYKDFLINWIKYQNPKYYNVPFYQKLTKETTLKNVSFLKGEKKELLDKDIVHSL